MTQPRPSPSRPQIYLDYHATTPLDADVFRAMEPFLRENFGNPSSLHAYGQRAQGAVDSARESVAQLIGARPNEVFFTSGATESNNFAIKGVLSSRGGGHVITSPTEHKSVLAPLHSSPDSEITYLTVDRAGRIDPNEVESIVRNDTVLITLMAANNEIGTIHPLVEVGHVARQKNILFHCDATQIVGKVPFNVDEAQIDLLSLSAHKLYGPKGIGAVFVRRGLSLPPLMHGGGQERGLRSGTLNVAGCVGLGVACEIAQNVLPSESGRTTKLRDDLFRGLKSELGGLKQNGDLASRLPGNLHITIDGVETDALVANLPDIAFGTGSACTSGSEEPSHVLLAIGLTVEQARASARFGVGRYTTGSEIQLAVARITDSVQLLRDQSEPIRENADRAGEMA